MAGIRDVVTRSVVSVDASASCLDAARIMRDRGIGSIAVADGGEIVGLVTERDLVVRLVADGLPADLPVARAVRRDLPRVSLDASEAVCAELMRRHVSRHLLVEHEGDVVGVVSMRDLIALMLADRDYRIGQLEGYIATA